MRFVSQMRITGAPVLSAVSLLVLLTACSTPLPDPELDPAGPVNVRIDTSIDFSVSNMPGAVKWDVNGTEGGTNETGGVVGGKYTAPARVPAEPTVIVTATDATNAGRSASAEVTITAPGTLYILDTDAIHVYKDMDFVDGNMAADRVFTLPGMAGVAFYDMAMAPALDIGFISTHNTLPALYRVSAISGVEGTVTATAFDTLSHNFISGLAYDADRDILYAAVDYAILAYDGASTAPADQAPTRIIAGASLDPIFLDSDTRLRVDAASDRLFVSNHAGTVAVYDGVSTATGEAQPDRLFTVDPGGLLNYLWGAAYDATRDELYLADQNTEGPIYVISSASTADGTVTPSRSIGGPATELVGPSQLGYDAGNDRLVVIDAYGNNVKVFDLASTLDGDVAPTRVIGGSNLPITYPYGGYLDPTQ